MTFLSLHSKPEPRPSRKDDQVQAVMWRFFICDFFVNFQEFGCLLAFQLGSYMKASFLANIDPNNYILVTDCKLWVQNSSFRGLVYRGFFFRNRFLSKNMSCPCLILSYFFTSTEKRKSHECCAICDFFVNFRKDSYILAVFVGYLLRGLFRGGYL